MCVLLEREQVACMVEEEAQLARMAAEASWLLRTRSGGTCSHVLMVSGGLLTSFLTTLSMPR